MDLAGTLYARSAVRMSKQHGSRERPDPPSAPQTPEARVALQRTPTWTGIVLKPPVEPMLAQARETVPGPGILPGGLAFEAKFDGYRCLLFTPSRPGDPTLLQSRRGSLLQSHFPDLVAATKQLPHGLVLDGEVVVWFRDRLKYLAARRDAPQG